MRILLLFCLLAVSQLAMADDLEVVVEGVGEAMTENIQAFVGNRWVSASALSSNRRRARFQADAETRAAFALRPFGYYFPRVTSTLTSAADKSWLLTLLVVPGEPVIVDKLELEITGPGAELEALTHWRRDWPLPSGARLQQHIWAEQKENALDLTEENGYLAARFVQHEIRLDLETNRADLLLVLDTGPQALMGRVEFEQALVKPHVLTPVPRFRPGDPYQAWLVDKLRTDLWRTGYWDEIEVIEERLLAQDPPIVNFRVVPVPGKPNTHQGTIGFGTDTEFRMQYRWQRNRISERGDSLSAGLGWQSRQKELLLFSEYRLPRKKSTNQYWALTPAFRRERQDFDLLIEGEGADEIVRVAEGRIDAFTMRFGRVKLRNLSFSREQLIETIFAQYLGESDDFDLDFSSRLLLGGARPELENARGIDDTRRTLAVGMEWDWPVVQGRGFEIRGHRERAHVFTSNEAWGSDVDFSQVYLSSRWEIPIGDQWKLSLRGEVGYSDANVFDTRIELEDQREVPISVTELPFIYRFKAGGSQSVRGYDFESLSDNGIGSNHILTASAEVEYQFVQDWSAAVFMDVGNAFNDWNDTKLKRGVGVGLRWYTLAGAIRLDYATALDIDGEPWRIHITIGTPLL